MQVLQEFRSSMPHKLYKEIVRIENIRNKGWYRQYFIWQNKMIFYSQIKQNTEKCLFHGCSEQAANNIMKEFFNRGFAGAHGIMYSFFPFAEIFYEYNFQPD